MKKTFVSIASAALAVSVLAGTALADFSPMFELKMSDTKVKANPNLDIHLEFDKDDEEIGNFQLILPKGFKIAPDDAIENNEDIGGGEITIEAGPGCRPGPEGAGPSAPATVRAVIEERDRTDEEVDAGVHAVWFLNLEPLNRVRLTVKGTPATGWTIEGAPTPSDNTCNPLIVDLTINGKSASGVPVVTNPKKGGKKVVTANIFSQDSPAVATFKQVFRITK